MKHLFVVRHGDYDSSTGRLSSKGEKQISNIVTQIKNLHFNNNAVIVTSTAPRALDSTDIIKKNLSIQDCVKVSFLWSHPEDAPELSYYKDQDPSKIMHILKSFMHKDVVILVSHLEVVNQFPKFFTKEIFGKELNCPKLDKGEAIHIDVSQKNFKLLKDIDIILEAKLELLHKLLVPSGIPDEIPSELSNYREAFEEFKQSVQGCTDCFDDDYIRALTKFRDVLLADLS